MRAIDADKLHKIYTGWLTQLKMPEDEKDFYAIATCIAVLEDQPAIEVPRWIPVTERLPTKEDADRFGRVLSVGEDGIVRDFTWRYLNWYPRMATHWMPLPDVP